MSDRKYFVFDTNALISAHLLEGSVTERAYERARSSGILVRSELTLIEFASRFIRPKFDRYISRENRLIKIEEYKKNSLLVRTNLVIQASRDPDDDIFLDLAIAANAACIISGDRDLLVLHPFYNIPILTPGDFLNHFK